MSEPAVEAAGLYKSYWDGERRLEILRNVNLRVQKGEGAAILGPSGSGKTTLLNLLSGLDRPDGGAVRLAGADISGWSENQKAQFRNKNVGFVFQFYHLLPEFTALENVMLPALVAGAGRHGVCARSRAESLLERVGLKERASHYSSELSGGEQQRVAIARALMNDPQILFCDEPTGNLDIHMASEIVTLLRGLLRERGKTVILVTHDEKVAQLAGQVWKITESGDIGRKN